MGKQNVARLPRTPHVAYLSASWLRRFRRHHQALGNLIDEALSPGTAAIAAQMFLDRALLAEAYGRPTPRRTATNGNGHHALSVEAGDPRR